MTPDDQRELLRLCLIFIGTSILVTVGIILYLGVGP